jgi:hypothetical protein
MSEGSKTLARMSSVERKIWAARLGLSDEHLNAKTADSPNEPAQSSLESVYHAVVGKDYKVIGAPGHPLWAPAMEEHKNDRGTCVGHDDVFVVLRSKTRALVMSVPPQACVPE